MRSLRTRLALLVFVIALGTVTIVGLGVLTSLETSLRDQSRLPARAWPGACSRR